MKLIGNISLLSSGDRRLLEKLRPDSGHIFFSFSSGKSGAIVLVLDIQGENGIQGPHVVKILDGKLGEEEYSCHNKISQTSISSHIPQIVDSATIEGRIAILYKVAGGHLLNIEPLSQLIKSDVARAAEFIKATVDLLEQINPIDQTIKHRNITKISDLVKHTINIGKERLQGSQSIKNRLAELFPNEDNSSIIFEGSDTSLPNPIAYVYRDNLWGDKQIIYTDGCIHGDLHSENIICDLRSPQVLLIDWGGFNEHGLSFFDWAYLEIDLMLRFLPVNNWEDWEEWLYLSEFSTKAIVPDGEPKGRRAPMAWYLVKPIREGVQAMINSAPFELREWIEISFLLSIIAVSLNFIRKNSVTRQDKTSLLMYCSRSLERILKELSILRQPVKPAYIALPREMADINWENVGIASQMRSEINMSEIERYDIFLSYAHEDIELAKRLVEDLRKRGYSVWYADSEIRGGEKWIESIAKGINLSPIFLSLVSSAGNESVWVKREFLYAENKGKMIIPVLIEPCELPIYILEKQVVEIKPSYPVGIKALIDILPPPGNASKKLQDLKFSRRLIEQAFVDRLLLRYEIWRELYTPLAGVVEDTKNTKKLKLPVNPAVMNPLFELIDERRQELGGSSPNEPYRVTSIIDEIKSRRRVALLGEPGAGKSTTLWRLVSELALECLKNPEAPLPLLVPLGGYNAESTLIEYIQKSSETLLGELSSFIFELLRDKKIALLLDGLNEMPRADYEGLVYKVKEFLDSNPEIIAVVTCREMDYTIDLNLDRIRISPLDPIQIKAFLRNYLKEDGENLFWKLIDPRARSDYWPRFKQAGGNEYDFWLAKDEPTGLTSPWFYWYWAYWLKIRDSPRSYLGIARNPFMLYMISQVFASNHDLPINRGQLFRLFVDVLIAKEGNKSRKDEWVDEKEQYYALSHLAFSMQKGGKLGTSLERNTAVKLLGDVRILYLAASENLLQIGERVRFTHQLLQEFFAAYALDQERIKGKPASEFWPYTQWWIPVGWEETSVLLAGLYKDDPLAVLNWLRDTNPELAARCLVDGGIAVKETIRQSLIAAWLPRLTDLREPVLARAAIGRALGLIGGDARPGVCLIGDNGLPVVEWCEIPAGKFYMGEDNSKREEDLPFFRISKYLITNAHYEAFIKDGGYTDKWRRCWTKSGWEQKGDRMAPEDYSETHNLPNHPRVGVNWYETVAFCNWLNIRLRNENRLPEGLEIRLPTEMEWEKAARGIDGRCFPWGNTFDDNKCNVINIESTTAVGIFPDGSSPFGVMDMIGNAWKWCLTKWRENVSAYEDNSLEGNFKRVYRGGSWGSDIWRSSSSERKVPINTFSKANESWGGIQRNMTAWDPIELHCGRRCWIIPEDDRPDAIGFFIVLGPILPK